MKLNGEWSYPDDGWVYPEVGPISPRLRGKLFVRYGEVGPRFTFNLFTSQLSCGLVHVKTAKADFFTTPETKVDFVLNHV